MTQINIYGSRNAISKLMDLSDTLLPIDRPLLYCAFLFFVQAEIFLAYTYDGFWLYVSIIWL